MFFLKELPRYEPFFKGLFPTYKVPEKLKKCLYFHLKKLQKKSLMSVTYLVIIRSFFVNSELFVKFFAYCHLNIRLSYSIPDSYFFNQNFFQKLKQKAKKLIFKLLFLLQLIIKLFRDAFSIFLNHIFSYILKFNLFYCNCNF